MKAATSVEEREDILGGVRLPRKWMRGVRAAFRKARVACMMEELMYCWDPVTGGWIANVVY